MSHTSPNLPPAFSAAQALAFLLADRHVDVTVSGRPDGGPLEVAPVYSDAPFSADDVETVRSVASDQGFEFVASAREGQSLLFRLPVHAL